MNMALCKWCKQSTARTPLGFCGLSCSTKWKNTHKNPMMTASPAAKARVQAAAKRQGNAHMMTADARAKALPKISAALRGRPGSQLGKPLSQEVREKISKTLEGRFVGADNPNWKGGMGNRDWKSARYKRFLKAVWQRAQGLCEVCGMKCPKGHKSNVHHKKPWDESPELRYDPSNGQLLCTRCHRNIHPHEFDDNQRRKISKHAQSRLRTAKGKFV